MEWFLSCLCSSWNKILLMLIPDLCCIAVYLSEHLTEIVTWSTVTGTYRNNCVNFEYLLYLQSSHYNFVILIVRFTQVCYNIRKSLGEGISPVCSRMCVKLDNLAQLLDTLVHRLTEMYLKRSNYEKHLPVLCWNSYICSIPLCNLISQQWGNKVMISMFADSAIRSLGLVLSTLFPLDLWGVLEMAH